MDKNQKSEIYSRILWGGLLSTFVLTGLVFSETLVANMALFALVLGFAWVAIREFEALAFSVSQGYVLPSALIIFLSTAYFFPYPSFFVVLLTFLLVYPFSIWQRVENFVSRLSHGLLAFFYVGMPCFFMVLFLKEVQQGTMPLAWMIFGICITKGADMGALAIGRSFGRLHLARSISPKKTYEGLLGGIVSALVITFCLNLIYPEVLKSNFETYSLAIVLVLLGLAGDLVESMFKRDKKIKDSNSLPGLGGALDILDAFTFTMPFLFEYLKEFHV